jgi:importin-7
MIIKQDFPHKWPEVVDKISIFLQTPDPTGWPGALSCLYQLVKNYEYKKKEDRGPINDAMNLLLPLIYEIVVRLVSVSTVPKSFVRSLFTIVWLS